MTYTMSTIRQELTTELPACPLCGGKMRATNHFRNRRPKELVGCVGQCDNKDCKFHFEDGFLGYDFEDLKKKILRFTENQNGNSELSVSS